MIEKHGAQQGNTLAHSARELMYITMLESFQMHQLNEVPGKSYPLSGRHTGLAQAKLDIPLDVEPGE